MYISKTANVATSITSIAQFITIVILFVFVCGITYFATRFIAKYQKGQMDCVNMEIIDTIQIAPAKYIQIVRIGSKYISLGVCKDTITVITELEENEIQFKESKDLLDTVNFKDVFEKARTLKFLKGVEHKGDDIDDKKTLK